jgi:putative transposase
VVVHAADIQDAEGAWDLLKRLKPLYCWLRVVFADSSYDRLAVLIACFLLGLTLIVVRRIAGITGFMVLPRRWVVERRSVGSDDGGGCRRIMRRCPRFLRRWSPWL